MNATTKRQHQYNGYSKVYFESEAEAKLALKKPNEAFPQTIFKVSGNKLFFKKNGLRHDIKVKEFIDASFIMPVSCFPP